MAKLNDTTIPPKFHPYLHAGETLKHWAYGVKQPHFLLIFVLYCLGILPGIIAVTLLTKHYFIALTDRRLIVLKTDMRFEVKEISEYALSPLPKVEAKTGILFTKIKIIDSAKPFEAKFHRMGTPTNRLHAMAIAAALLGNPLPSSL